MSGEKEGYDQAVSLYSPEGRIYQVEYAREASRRGSLAFAIRYRDGVLVAAHKGRASKLVRTDKIEKIYRLSEDMVAVTSGLIADSRILADYLREVIGAQKRTYGEGMGIKALAAEVGEALWMYSEYGSVRPFGVSLILVGPRDQNDRTISLVALDVMGSFHEMSAVAIGQNFNEANEIFATEYKPNMSKAKAVQLAEKVFRETISSDLKEHVFDLCTVTKKGIDINPWKLE